MPSRGICSHNTRLGSVVTCRCNSIRSQRFTVKKTRRMAIANGTCVSFSNQPKAHYLATSRESRRYVVAFSRFAGVGIWLRQESLRHILASPGFAPGPIAVNVTWIEREFNACQTPRSMYTHLSSTISEIKRVIGRKLRYFPTPLHPVGVFPLEFRENVWTSEN